MSRRLYSCRHLYDPTQPVSSSPLVSAPVSGLQFADAWQYCICIHFKIKHRIISLLLFIVHCRAGSLSSSEYYTTSVDTEDRSLSYSRTSSQPSTLSYHQLTVSDGTPTEQRLSGAGQLSAIDRSESTHTSSVSTDLAEGTQGAYDQTDTLTQQQLTTTGK